MAQKHSLRQLASTHTPPSQPSGALRVERLDPALDRLIPADAKIEILAESHDWSEGPVWVKDGGFLLFSDVPQNVIYRWIGLAFSPDDRQFYVAQSDPAAAIWRVFDLKPDGTIGEGRVFFDATPLTKTRTGLPDGLKVDADGNLFASGPGGILVFSPQGKHLGTIMTGQATSNCAFGDDGRTLYMTADMYLMRIRLNTKGRGF